MEGSATEGMSSSQSAQLEELGGAWLSWNRYPRDAGSTVVELDGNWGRGRDVEGVGWVGRGGAGGIVEAGGRVAVEAMAVSVGAGVAVGGVRAATTAAAAAGLEAMAAINSGERVLGLGAAGEGVLVGPVAVSYTHLTLPTTPYV